MTSYTFIDSKWIPIYLGIPEKNKIILVFRDKNKKYIIAKLVDNHNKEESDEENSFDWETQQNILHAVKDDDCWLEFPYLRQECLYD